jgi:hypothetical protein
MRNRCFCFIAGLVFFYSCASAPDKTNILDGTLQDGNGSHSNNRSEYVPSREIYTRTFEEVDGLINTLNEVIKNRDFSAWLEYLSDSYKKEKSDPSFLSELSNQPTLVAKKIRLGCLKDYFEYVIVPSRTNSMLERIIFLSEDHVKALSTLYGQSVILFNLVRIDGVWKIGNTK